MRFWLCASAAFVIATVGLLQQVPEQGHVSARNANETLLAHLRPGRSTMKDAQQINSNPASEEADGSSRTWADACRKLNLQVEEDKTGRISVVRVSELFSTPDCFKKMTRTGWRTGHDLAVGDTAQKAVAIYGEPTSRSPSTKNGQPLELLYYAFDWAGPDVPQVMEVVCTAPKDGSPGLVVEITLAASSL